MPEILEIEMYRRGAEALVGRRITEVHAPDAWYLKKCDAVEVAAVLCGSRVVGVDRIGKLLLIETTEARVGLRFGMTGRLVIDEQPIIQMLEYSSARLDPAWTRFEVSFDVGRLAMNDPRRLGGVALEPDTSALGIDAWRIDADGLARIAAGRTVAIKTLLLDQSRVAGLGNLLVDELLWRVGVHPGRSVAEISDAELERLAAQIPPMLDELFERGGSHRGSHVPMRDNGARCGRDGGPMQHATIGGRSTWWCSTHQR